MREEKASPRNPVLGIPHQMLEPAARTIPGFLDEETEIACLVLGKGSLQGSLNLMAIVKPFE